jgi:serine/threonine protein kinase
MISPRWRARQIHTNRRKPLQLTVNIDSINQDVENIEKSPQWKHGDVYRADGLSIGQDYLRVEGITITRGELNPSSIKVMEVIGKGAFSTVHKAHWRRKRKRAISSNDSSEIEEVAIKTFSIIDSCRQRKNMLLKELRNLCKFNSPCLVKFHGAFLHIDDVTLVMEYMISGSLECLFQDIKSSCKRIPSVQNTFLSNNLSAAISYQILSGLAYLHAPERRMLHRDLKPVNILLDRINGSVKLCDFGLSSSLGENSMNKTVVGTTIYMSPERLRAKAYGRPSDVWSFGLILLECITGEAPWKDITSAVDLVMTIEESNVNDFLPSKMRVNSSVREVLGGTLQIDPCTLKKLNSFLEKMYIVKWIFPIRQVELSHHSVSTLQVSESPRIYCYMHRGLAMSITSIVSMIQSYL